MTARSQITDKREKVWNWSVRANALLWRQLYWIRYKSSILRSRHGWSITASIIIVLMAISVYFSLTVQDDIERRFANPIILSNFRSLLLTLGATLVGAAAIAFSLVVFAMQVNVERMPHGLFRRFSSDLRLMTAFGSTFFVAIAIACASLIPNPSWVTPAALLGGWGSITVFVLFLYVYRRALLLVNPVHQLSLVVERTTKELRTWGRRAKRAKPLLQETDDTDRKEPESLRSTHDMARTVYFQVNPHWTMDAKRAVLHAMSFARRYAEQGDHEVVGASLSAVVAINAAYVKAKGKTFYANPLILDNPLSTDEFINETLEHLRQNVRLGLARGDEQQIEQTLQAMAGLFSTYLAIDYSDSHASFTHAHLAAGYLSGAVQSVVPHDMADVIMEGMRLMGNAAFSVLATGRPNDISTLVDNIGTVSLAGVAKADYRPITLAGVEQIARLTIALIRTDARDVRFASGRLTANMASIAKHFLQVPDSGFSSAHSTYLAPYYSGTASNALRYQLTDLANALIQADAENKTAKVFVRNVEEWADGIYQRQKELLLLAIEKGSHFTFDIIHWIADIAKLLLAISNAPACESHTRDSLQKHALWLLYTLSWVPDDKDSVTFIENFQMTEVLFEASLEGRQRAAGKFSDEARDLLFGWAFKAGKHETGWGILERAIYGLAALELSPREVAEARSLLEKMEKRLAQPDAPDQKIRDRTAREIRIRAATLHRDEGWSSTIEHVMSQVDQKELRALLEDLANLLSPNTKDDPVETDFF